MRFYSRKTKVQRCEDGWAVVFWPDPFDMLWYERGTWREAIELAQQLEAKRGVW